MNQQSKMLTPPIDETVRSLRKIAPLALAALVVTIALLITYIPNVPAMAQAERGAIPSLALASSEPGQLVITWETPDPTPTDYRVSWANASMRFLSYKNPNEEQRANVYPDGGETILTLNDLTPGQDYKVQMRSRYYNADRSVRESSGPWTATATQRVKDHPPAAPTGLAASSIEHDSLTLTWNNPQDTNITGYRVLRGTDASSLSVIQADTGSASTEYTDAAVNPETTYHYAVLALSLDGDGPQSSTVSATTPAAPRPAAPTGLNASQVSHSVLTLTWDDPQDVRITGYRILRGTDADSLAALEEDTGSSSTLYTDATVEPETTYFYAVNALSADSDGDQSRAISATTPAAPQSEEQPIQNDPPEAPTGLTASSIEHDSLTLGWNDPQDDSITGYRILRGIASKNLPTIEEDTKSSSPSYTDTTVGEATTYFYEIIALSSNMESRQSDKIDVTTPASSIRSVSRQNTAPSTQTLVGNMDRATHHMTGLVAKDLAQEFKTGPHTAGYKLSSVDLYMTGTDDLTVWLVEGSAGNQQITVQLTPPIRGLIGHDVYSFSPPASTTLAPNKNYWIVVKGNRNGWFKAELGEDATAAHGWKLADTYDYRPKYQYAEDGTQSINTETEFRQFQGNLSIRINRLNNPATGEPTIAGLAYVGEPLTALVTGISDQDDLADPFDSLTYQWKRYSADGVTFEANVGTNSRTYTLAPTDEGKKIRVAVHFTDNDGNGEGPLASASHPSRGTVGPAAPLSSNLVSNTSQSGNSDNQFGDEVHAQAFTTGSERNGYILAKVAIISEDAEEDDIALRVCEVDRNTHPTETCTDLIPPTLFEMGPLVFSAQPGRTIRLEPDTTYSVVFNSPGGQDVKLDATDSDSEDTSSLAGWSIRNKSQFQRNNQWEDRGYDRAILIAITGRLSPNEAPAGIPVMTGLPALGQILTASTESITDPDGVPTSFTYQWKRYTSDNVFEADIGTNLPTYTLTAPDEGKKIKVEVSYIDNQGYIEGPLASPLSAVISAAPLSSNISQKGKSTTSVSTLLSQAFTTGSETHGYTISKVTIFYEDEDRQPLNLKICGASSNGIPNQECVTLSPPPTFSSGLLNFTPPNGEPIQLDGNTTHVAQFEWPNAAKGTKGARDTTSEETKGTRADEQEDDFVESLPPPPEPPPSSPPTNKYPPDLGITTSNGEDALTASGWSIGNTYQKNSRSRQDTSSSRASVRMAIYGTVTPNSPATGAPGITGTTRVGYTLTAPLDDIIDTNGIPDTFTYQWKRYSAEGAFEADIGVNSNQYTIKPSDLGKKIKVQVNFTDRSNYIEGPLASEIYPPGSLVVVSVEDDLLVSNSGHPVQQTVSITSKVAQVFTTGDNPNGYSLTSVAVPGSNASIEICWFDSQHYASPGTYCLAAPIPESPVQLGKQWLYAVVLDPDGTQADMSVTEIGQDPTSLPSWSIRGKYQVQNQQNEWRSITDNHAIRIELHGRPRSAVEQLGQLTATPGNRETTLSWQTWTPNNDNVIQKFQYRVKLPGGSWDPGWTNIPGSNAGTESHTVSNLTNGIEHTIQLRAVFIQDGQTVLGGAETIRATPRAPLTAPGNLDASTEGDGGVRLSWSDPADSTLTGYQYRQRNTSDTGWNPDWKNIPGGNALTNQHTLTRLQKNIRHTFEVRMLRGTEQGPAASSSVTPRGPMPHLQNLIAAADDRQVTLSWDNPGDHGITGYQHRYRAETDSDWNPDWTSIPGSNASTTSHTVRPLVNLTSYTFEVRALRGLEEGPASSTSATTPDGPAAVPKEPRNMSARQRDQGFTASWGVPADEDQRAPVTSYRVRHREIGTSSWHNLSVTADDCCGKTITGLRNRRHYEVQVAAVNRLGTSPWSGLVNVTPQAPHSAPPAPTGDADLSLGPIGQGWTTTGNNTLINSCIGPRSFYIIWDGPEGRDRRADEWAAHINTTRGAGEVTYAFRESPDVPGYYDMYGTVNFQGPGKLSINVRGRFGQTWGTWSRIDLYCFE